MILTTKKKSRGMTLIELMIVVAIIGILTAVGTYTALRNRDVAHQRACQENLVKINGAKELWALEQRRGTNDSPTLSDLYSPDRSGYLKLEPRCPSEGTYSFETVGDYSTCTISLPRDHNDRPGTPLSS